MGQQHNPVKHFTLKRKPKSTTLRAELLQKSCDAQSTLKKVSAPTIPLRSRGMPRKMTDTTPLKGIPSRVPTSGFRSPPTQSQNRPNFSRMTAGRKDGGIKLLEITEQPLGYAAAKKRKRQQDLEEQQKKTAENQNNNNSPTSGAPVTVSTTTPDYAAGLSATTVYTQPPTPYTPIKTERPLSPTLNIKMETSIPSTSSTVTVSSVTIDTKPVLNLTPSITTATPTLIRTSSITTPLIATTVSSSLPSTATALAQNSSPNISLQSNNNPTKLVINQTSNTNAFVSSLPMVIKQENYQSYKPETYVSTKLDSSTIKMEDVSNKIIITSKPQIISSISNNLNSNQIKSTQSQINSFGLQQIITSPNTSNNIIHIPRQTTIKQISKPQTQILQTQKASFSQHPTQLPQSKIVQIKTQPQIMVSHSNSIQCHQNIPPLISTQSQSSNKINIQNIQNFNIPLNKLKLENSTPTNIIRMSTPQQTTIQQIQSPTQSNQQNIGQLVISPANMNVKGKTIILANPNQLSQKGVIIRSVGPSGNTVYQQIPISNVSGLANIINNGNTQAITTKIEQPSLQKHQQIPALVPSSSYQSVPSLTPLMMQQQTIPTLLTHNPQKTTIIRPVQMANVQGVNVIPQGLTLIQRPGQQPQLVQTIQQQLPRTIISQQVPQQSEQNMQPQMRQQTIFVPQQKINPNTNTQNPQVKKGITLPVI